MKPKCVWMSVWGRGWVRNSLGSCVFTRFLSVFISRGFFACCPHALIILPRPASPLFTIMRVTRLWGQLQLFGLQSYPISFSEILCQLWWNSKTTDKTGSYHLKIKGKKNQGIRFPFHLPKSPSLPRLKKKVHLEPLSYNVVCWRHNR